MLLQIRRPVRPDPRPLRERTGSEAVNRIAYIWLAVRQKRSRAATPQRSKIWLTSRGPSSAPRR
jgi:hypothetical protein